MPKTIENCCKTRFLNFQLSKQVNNKSLLLHYIARFDVTQRLSSAIDLYALSSLSSFLPFKLKLTCYILITFHEI